MCKKNKNGKNIFRSLALNSNHLKLYGSSLIRVLNKNINIAHNTLNPYFADKKIKNIA